MLRQMSELEKQLQALRLEKEKLEGVEAERERGTAKGRTFEEAVAEAVDEIALAQGDVAEAVGDLKEATGKVGDVVVAIDACNGPARGRLVFEAKDRQRLSGPKALKELDDAIAERSADFAVMVVPGDDRIPAKMEPLREYNGDKLIVALDPHAGSLPLEVAYRLARARVLMKRSNADGIDAAAVAALAERALAALSEERKVKQQLTGAKTSIDKAYEHVDSMSARVRGLLQEIDSLVRTSDEVEAAVDDDQLEL
jgi:chromosome segregation ATPase